MLIIWFIELPKSFKVEMGPYQQCRHLPGWHAVQIWFQNSSSFWDGLDQRWEIYRHLLLWAVHDRDWCQQASLPHIPCFLWPTVGGSTVISQHESVQHCPLLTRWTSLVLPWSAAERNRVLRARKPFSAVPCSVSVYFPSWSIVQIVRLNMILSEVDTGAHVVTMSRRNEDVRTVLFSSSVGLIQDLWVLVHCSWSVNSLLDRLAADDWPSVMAPLPRRRFALGWPFDMDFLLSPLPEWSSQVRSSYCCNNWEYEY